METLEEKIARVTKEKKRERPLVVVVCSVVVLFLLLALFVLRAPGCLWLIGFGVLALVLLLFTPRDARIRFYRSFGKDLWRFLQHIPLLGRLFRGRNAQQRYKERSSKDKFRDYGVTAAVLIAVTCVVGVMCEGQRERQVFREKGIRVVATVVTKYTNEDMHRDPDETGERPMAGCFLVEFPTDRGTATATLCNAFVPELSWPQTEKGARVEVVYLPDRLQKSGDKLIAEKVIPGGYLDR